MPKTQKDYSRTHYLKYKDRIKARMRLYNLTPAQKERKAIYNKAYFKKNAEKFQIRNKILILLGNKCVKCGFSDKRALQIDHVHGKGLKEIARFKSTYQYYRFVLEQIKNGSKDYQLLCANCNWIKRYENKECKNP